MSYNYLLIHLFIYWLIYQDMSYNYLLIHLFIYWLIYQDMSYNYLLIRIFWKIVLLCSLIVEHCFYYAVWHTTTYPYICVYVCVCAQKPLKSDSFQVSRECLNCWIRANPTIGIIMVVVDGMRNKFISSHVSPAPPPPHTHTHTRL